MFVKYFFEKKILNNAKGIVTVSNGCYQSIKNNLKKTNYPKLHILENLPDDYQKSFFYSHFNNPKTQSKYFNINFIGTIYKIVHSFQ